MATSEARAHSKDPPTWTAILLLPISLPILALGFTFIFLPIGVYCLIGLRWSMWRLRRNMRRADRILKASDVETILQERRGTILIDSPTPGWGIVTVWWTADDALASAPPRPIPEGEEDPEELFKNRAFYQWIYDRYINERDGRASLIETRRGRTSRLDEKYANGKVVYLWSGMLSVGRNP